jgi:hypothetical protein
MTPPRKTTIIFSLLCPFNPLSELPEPTSYSGASFIYLFMAYVTMLLVVHTTWQ